MHFNGYSCKKFIASKNKPSIPLDGADAGEEMRLEAGKADVSEVPSGFYTLYYLAIKYLVVLALKNFKDTYTVSFLVSAGAGGIDSSAIGKKSRKDLEKERRYT